jgi:hypothetical protein
MNVSIIGASDEIKINAVILVAGLKEQLLVFDLDYLYLTEKDAGYLLEANFE